MELEHSFTVPVPKKRAWDVLLDVERVAPCMPGTTLDSVDGDLINGRIKVKVGPISMTYVGKAEIVEKDEQAGLVRLEASGKETRGAGTASATVRSVLEDRGDETRVTVLTTMNVTGKPAQFGRGVMNEVSGKLISIFANNLAEMLGGDGSDADDESESAAPAPAPVKDAAPAADVTAAPEQASAAAASEASIDELQLNARAVAALQRAGLRTVGQLAAKSSDELLAIEGIGPASVDEITAKLAEHNRAAASAPAPASTVSAAATPSASSDAGTTRQSGAARAAANGASTSATTTAPKQTPRPSSRRQRDESLNLLKVAGGPVLKRGVPVLAGITAVFIFGWRRRLRRRNK